MLSENACLLCGGSIRLWRSGTRAGRKLGPLTYISLLRFYSLTLRMSILWVVVSIVAIYGDEKKTRTPVPVTVDA